MDKKIRDIMTPDPVGVYYDQTLAETARVMRDAGVGVVLVVNGDSLSGVVTDRDLVIRGLAGGAGPDSPVGPVCSAKLVGVDADAGEVRAEAVLHLLLDRRGQRLARAVQHVVHGGALKPPGSPMIRHRRPARQSFPDDRTHERHTYLRRG